MNTELRTSSRLAAVQAHYELDLVGGNATEIADAFLAKRWSQAATAGRASSVDPETGNGFDEPLFRDLMEGALRDQSMIDNLIRGTLSRPDSYDRLETLVRSILRVATYELSNRMDVPVKVVISEYLDLAHDFFDGSQVSLINGVLDSLAHRLRQTELSGRQGLCDSQPS